MGNTAPAGEGQRAGLTSWVLSGNDTSSPAPETPVARRRPWSFQAAAERLIRQREHVAQEGARAVPPRWTQHFHERRGRPFWVDGESGTATWVKPPSAVSLGTSSASEPGRPPGVVVGVTLQRERLELLTRLLLHQAVGDEVEALVELAKSGRNPFAALLSLHDMHPRLLPTTTARDGVSGNDMEGVEQEGAAVGFVEAVTLEALSFSVFRRYHSDSTQLQAALDGIFCFLPALDAKVMPLRWDLIRQQSVAAVSGLLCHISHATEPAAPHRPQPDAAATLPLPVLMLQFYEQLTANDSGQALLKAIVAANTIDDLPARLHDNLVALRARLLALLHWSLHAPPTTNATSRWVALLRTLPQQTIVTLARLRHLAGGSLVRSLLEALLSPAALTHRSTFQELCAAQLGVGRVQRWIAEALQTLPDGVRGPLAARLSTCEQFEDLATVVQEAPQLVEQARQQPSTSLLDSLWGAPTQLDPQPNPHLPSPSPIADPPSGTTDQFSASSDGVEKGRQADRQAAVDLETVFLIVNLEGYRRGAEQLVQAYGDPVFTSLVKELYPAMLDPFVDLFPGEDLATFLEVLFASFGRILDTSANSALDEAARLAMWAEELAQVEEALFTLVRRAVVLDFGLWADTLRWGGERLAGARVLGLHAVAEGVANELPPATLEELWREVDLMLPGSSQRRPSYFPGSLSSASLDHLPAVAQAAPLFAARARHRLAAARAMIKRARPVAPFASPQPRPDDQTPLQHVRLVGGDEVEVQQLVNCGFERVGCRGEVEAGGGGGRGLGIRAGVSVWIKRGPHCPSGDWEVPPLTSLVLADTASALIEKNHGTTILPTDLHPPFPALGLQGKLFLGYRRGEPDKQPIAALAFAQPDEVVEVDAAMEEVSSQSASLFRSMVRLLVRRVPMLPDVAAGMPQCHPGSESVSRCSEV